ncbi:hypothetical protein C8R47DRAFT_1221313 [Mycena vitilis]|nr:hypothetical protein C8R47DRAFT_1221313 [Mycena vitilis]
MASTPQINSFAIQGPWVHPLTLQLGLPTPQHRPTEDQLTQVIYEGSGIHLARCRALVRSILQHERQCFARLSNIDRGTVAYELGLRSTQGSGVANNNTVPLAIRNGLLPLLVLDTVLHTSQPSCVAVALPRLPVRPLIGGFYQTHFIHANSWYSVLKECSKIEETKSALRKTPPPNLNTLPDGPKKKCLQRLTGLNSKSYPGSKAEHNVSQAVFMVRAIIQGHCVLTKDIIIDLSFQDARIQDDTITRQEVQDVIPNPNISGIPSALAVALIYSPIFLLRDIGYADRAYDPGFSILKLWRARGNTHHIDCSHPLDKIDSILWKLFLTAAVGKIQPETVPELFFASPEVQGILRGVAAEHGDALKYASDELDTASLHTIPQDYESSLELPMPPVQNALFSNRQSASSLIAKSSCASVLTLGPNKETNKVPGATKTRPPPVADAGLTMKYRTRSSDNTLPKTAAPAPPGSRTTCASSTVKRLKRRPGATKNDPIMKIGTAQWEAPTPPPESVRLRAHAKTHPLDINAPRSLEQEPINMELFAPGSELGEHVRRNFAYRMFSKYACDREMLRGMLASMPKDANKLPLFLGASARNPDPEVHPSETCSVFFVCTRQQWYKLDTRTQYLMHRHRCVLMLDVGAEPAPPFDENTLCRFGDPRKPCFIQDSGLDQLRDDECLRVGSLRDLLPHVGRPVLQAPHQALPFQGMATPLGFHLLASADQAITHLHGHMHLPDVQMPWRDLHWATISTSMARSPIRSDVFATVITVLTGAKLVAIAIPMEEVTDRNWSSRHAFTNWEASQRNAYTDAVRWELLLLLPDMTLSIGHGMPYFTLSLDDTVTLSFQSIQAAQTEAAVQVILHHIVTQNAATKSPHDSARWLLLRLFIFWVDKITQDTPVTQNHFPDLQTKRGLLELLCLQSFVLLYPALNPDSYTSAVSTSDELGPPLEMSMERYVEYRYALMCCLRLAAYVDGHFSLRCQHHNFTTFRELVEYIAIHMACCLSRYRRHWYARREDSAGRITPEAFDQQLRRALSSYNSVLDHEALDHDPGPRPDYNVQFIGGRIVDDFNVKLSSHAPFTHFLPWDAALEAGSARAMPVILERLSP